MFNKQLESQTIEGYLWDSYKVFQTITLAVFADANISL